MDRKVRVRFAPSPTGPLHIGGVRTALYNYLFAKKHGGDFLLRIEDTDQTRYVAGAEDYILESLKWSGLKFDEGVGVEGGECGPYRQSERNKLGIYKKYVDQLLEAGHAYYAFDTPDELEAMRERLKAEGGSSQQYDCTTRHSMKNAISLSAEEVKSRLASGAPYVVRVKIPRNEEIKFKDIIRGWVVVDSTNLDDKVLYKSDGMPTYHLANVVDDYLMKISHVIRGEEWLPSGPLHVLLYRFLGWEDVMPEFAHLPLLLKPDGNGKLSKRDGDRLGFPVFPIEWTSPEGEISNGYRESGYFPESFINMLAFLGWNPGTEQEIFSLEQLIQSFDLERVGKSGAKFDPEKTKWFNEQYLRAKSNEELAQLIKPILESEGIINIDKKVVESVCGLMKERATFLGDIYKNGSYFFTAPTLYDAETVKKKWKEDSPKIVAELITVFSNTEFKATVLEAAFKTYVEEKGIGFGLAMIAIRLAITGVGGGPSLFDIMEVIGKEESIKRLNAGIENIKNEITA
ncbi:MAG: glutamate--tRNA ligase [Flavobacteriales bacterium]|nr:glutamate--tRNA ligase [Flavobacteriales bacterium]